jgi:hypothetical protein
MELQSHQPPDRFEFGLEEAVPEELRAPARLLEYKRGAFVAFPAHTTLGLIECPPVVAVPGAPYYCHGLIAWQGRQLPLLDLNTLLRAYPEAAEPPIGHVLVLAYQSAPGQPLEYGAVCARLLVRMIDVADSQQCELPGDSDLWPWVSLACFDYAGHAVPVLDTSRIFAPPQP